MPATYQMSKPSLMDMDIPQNQTPVPPTVSTLLRLFPIQEIWRSVKCLLFLHRKMLSNRFMKLLWPVLVNLSNS